MIKIVTVHIFLPEDDSVCNKLEKLNINFNYTKQKELGEGYS